MEQACSRKEQPLGIKNAAPSELGKRRGDCYECSECGGGSVVNTNLYCWKCGAKMDGKDGESDG